MKYCKNRKRVERKKAKETKNNGNFVLRRRDQINCTQPPRHSTSEKNEMKANSQSISDSNSICNFSHSHSPHWSDLSVSVMAALVVVSIWFDIPTTRRRHRIPKWWRWRMTAAENWSFRWTEIDFIGCRFIYLASTAALNGGLLNDI